MSPITLARRTATAAVLASLPTLASCERVVSQSKVLSFLEAVQRPFNLQDRTWLGIPAALPAHLIVSASLAGALAWLWRPKAAGVLLGILILTKEAVDLMIIALYEPLTWAYASGLGRGCPGFGRRGVPGFVGRHPGSTKSCRERLRPGIHT